MKSKQILLGLVIGAIVVALIQFYPDWQHWIAYETGSANTSSSPPNYDYWSGFGSVFPWSMGTLGSLLALIWVHTKKANCHTHKCLRIGSYPVGDYKVCKKHHFEATGSHPTIEHIREHYQRKHSLSQK
jgi:hypothetical protein